MVFLLLGICTIILWLYILIQSHYQHKTAYILRLLLQYWTFNSIQDKLFMRIVWNEFAMLCIGIAKKKFLENDNDKVVRLSYPLI